MKIKPAKLIRIAQITMSISALAVLGWVGYQGVIYVRTAPRFDVQKITVSGLKHVRESEVLANAGLEVGANVFRVKLDQVREQVEQLPWVRYALVERILPDQIVIKIVEREPVGLARIRGEVYQFDAEGTVLDPDGSGSSFPILDGLRTGDKKNSIKVGTYQRVVEELGQASLSEIHINDSGEVTVVSASDPLVINLGGGDFRNRWRRYLQLKAQIQQQYPEAVRIDLRFKNQVIVRMKDDDTGGQIVWGEKKNTL
jgi:cell division septal protein FtsQ